MGYNSKDLLKLLEFNGFTLKRIVGIIPISHPKKDMAVGTYNNIL